MEEIYLKELRRVSQEGGFLNSLRSLITVGLPIMKNLLTTLGKNVLLPFALAGGMSATDAAIHWIGNEIRVYR